MASEGRGERTFGVLDQVALWSSLGATLTLMPYGSLLVPALSLERAFLAVALAACLGGLLVGAVAAIGDRTGLSTPELLGELFGARASPLTAALLLARNLAWAAFVLALAAQSAEAVSERALGAGLRPLWVIGLGSAGLALAVAGPQFTVRRYLRRAGVWLVLLVAAVITVSAFLEFGIPAYLQRPASGGWPSFWQAVDVMLVVPLLWLPLAADYGRLGRGAGGTFFGTFAGMFVATVWFGFLGVVYLPAVETGDVAGFVVGMNLGMGALALLLLLQADELFANLHSAGVALRTVLPVDTRSSALSLGALVIALTLPFDFAESAGPFLLLASLFVPLFGVLIAQEILGRWSDERAPVAPALAGWALGFLLYHWISPADVGWWRSALSWLLVDAFHLPFPLSDTVTWLGAAIPSFLLAFLVHAAGSAGVARLRGALAAARKSPEARPA